MASHSGDSNTTSTLDSIEVASISDSGPLEETAAPGSEDSLPVVLSAHPSA